jgi:glycosyltransferase involved in cell wall biosynthesis
VRARIRELCFDAGVDVVHLAWTEMGRYLDAVPRCTATLLGTLDVEAEVRPREVAILPRGPRRRRARAAARRLARRERRYVRRADAVVAVSAADAAALGRLRGKDDVTIVPPWLDAKILGRVTPEEVVAGRLTFVGALEREANRAAARWLVDEVWPRVRATHGRATLHLVGGSPPEDLRRRAVGEASLVVTGWVPDLIPVWAATDVAVAPSPVGGGLLLKVAQPMAAGRPVVTTTLGNAGVAAPGGAVAVADEAGAFAAEVVRLLNDGERWRRLAKRGRDHVLTTLNWEDGMERLEAAYAAALARRGRA